MQVATLKSKEGALLLDHGRTLIVKWCCCDMMRWYLQFKHTTYIYNIWYRWLYIYIQTKYIYIFASRPWVHLRSYSVTISLNSNQKWICFFFNLNCPRMTSKMKLVIFCHGMVNSLPSSIYRCRCFDSGMPPQPDNYVRTLVQLHCWFVMRMILGAILWLSESHMTGRISNVHIPYLVLFYWIEASFSQHVPTFF